MSLFANEKRKRLDAADLSRKGAVDDRINAVVDTLNSLPNYYTTSSCSGRTIVFSAPEVPVHVSVTRVAHRSWPK